MPATYVKITREEMEEALDEVLIEIQSQGRWYREAGKTGVYTIPLSNEVGVQVSTSIGQQDAVMSVGKAAIHTKLISRITGDVLNKKDAGQSRVNRTKGWVGNLTKVIKNLVKAYQTSPKFYNIIASKNGLDSYTKQWTEAIEGILDWQSVDRLRELHQRLQAKRILSDRDEEFITRFEDERIPDEPQVYVPKKSPHELPDQEWLDRIQALPGWERSKFLQDMVAKINMGRLLTTPMKKAIMRFEQTATRPPPSTTSPEYRAKWVDIIQNIPGSGSNNFLREILEKVRQGAELTENQEKAIKKVESFLKVLRENWLNRLRRLWAATKGNPDLQALIVRIGKGLQTSAEAHPSEPDMDALSNAFGRDIDDLILESRRFQKPQRRASLVERVATLYMGKP